ncbi:hypothetical protein HUJ04_007703 [Dendroctonus ponderosae]|nr:hypothetical protein HUJ04_007703 [Dendroctonus ponderosae]
MAKGKTRIDRLLFPLLTDVLEISNRMLRIGIYGLLANILVMLIVQLLSTRVTFLLTSKAFSKIRNIISSEIVWDLDLTDQAIYRKIIIKRTIFKRHLMAQFFFVFWLCISTIYELCMQLDEYSVIAEYIKQHYPFFLIPSIWFYVVETIVSSFVIALFPMYLYYCCELVEMQVHIMSLHIKKFREQLNLHGGSSSFVENGLKKIIKQHHNLLRCNALMRKHMQTAQIIIYCTMFPCTICITIMLFSGKVVKVFYTIYNFIRTCKH